MDIEEEIDKMYEEIDQYQAEMEELGLINYGDTGYYWRNPEEYEKDKKICELESEIERLRYLLEISDKALELACWYVECDFDGYSGVGARINYFKNKAKEKTKSE